MLLKVLSLRLNLFLKAQLSKFGFTCFALSFSFFYKTQLNFKGLIFKSLKQYIFINLNLNCLTKIPKISLVPVRLR